MQEYKVDGVSDEVMQYMQKNGLWLIFCLGEIELNDLKKRFNRLVVFKSWRRKRLKRKIDNLEAKKQNIIVNVENRLYYYK